MTGTIADASGKPVAGAYVKLKNDEKRLTFMVISRDQGRFEAKDLPPGKYRVQGVGAETQSQWFSNVTVTAAGEDAKVGLVLTESAARRLHRHGRNGFPRRWSTSPRRTRAGCPKARDANSSPSAASPATTCSGSSSSAPTRTTGATPSPACAPA